VTSDEEFAAELAAAAGRVLRATRDEHAGLPLRELKDLGDRNAQAEIAATLQAHRPGDAVLSEEAADTSGRTGRDRVWIIDPLDGTREFAEGRPDWAVHVALWERAVPGPDGELTVGAVAIPDEDLVLSSGAPPAVPPRAGGPLRIAVSRTRPAPQVAQLTEHLAAAGIETVLVPMGSAGVKIAAVVRGQVDVYVHGGGQYEWDSAAPACVARAAGLHTSRLDGSPLVYNQPDPYLPDLVVCPADLAGTVLDALRA
jgi:3'(2'), 5'-bisphosphate nucleotidase